MTVIKTASVVIRKESMMKLKYYGTAAEATMRGFLAGYDSLEVNV